VWLLASATPIATASCSGDIFDAAEQALQTGSTTCATIAADSGRLNALFGVAYGR